MVAASLVVAAADTRPAAAQSFEDGVSRAHGASIEALAELGVLDGTECGEGLFCPRDPVHRWVMAVWLVRILDGAEAPAGSESSGPVRFVDVDPDEWWAPYVERLAELDVTKGCAVGPLRFCPEGFVTRAQMASFLVRAFELDPVPDSGFVDIDGNVHESNIDALVASGITQGCSLDPLSFCPRDDTTRAQMATFLKRAIDMHADNEEPDDEEPDGGSPSGGGSPPGNVGSERVAVTIESVQQGTANAPFAVTIRFSETVLDLLEDQVRVSNGELTSLRQDPGDPLVWTATITPSPDFQGRATVTIPAGAVGTGSRANSATSQTFDVDTLAPTVVISGPSGAQSEPFDVGFDWSETVSGFTAGDVRVSGGARSGFTGSGRSYEVTVTPSARPEGTVTVSVAAGAASDINDNANVAASRSFDVDVVAPAVQITAPEGTQPGPFDVEFEWSEAVTGFALSDVMVGNGTASGLSGSGRSYEVTVTPDADGAVTVEVAAGATEDLAGNASRAAVRLSRQADVTPPGVTLSSTSPDAVAVPFDVDIDFTETVTGFAVEDIAVTNATLSGFSGTGQSYEVTVTADTQGEVTVSVPADKAHDAAGHGNEASDSLTRTATVAPSEPTGVTLTVGGGRITAEWDAPDSDGGSVLTGYRVQWKRAGQPWSAASSALAPLKGRAHTIDGLTNGTTYRVRVAATYGESEVGPTSSQASAAPSVATGAPKNLEVEVRHTRLRLTWKAPDSTGGATITDYLVQWKTGDESYSADRQRATTDLSDPGDTVDNLDNGTAYTVRVTTRSGTTTIGSSTVAAVPVSAEDHIETEVIQDLEADFPWVRQAWSNEQLPVHIYSTHQHAAGYVHFKNQKRHGFDGQNTGHSLFFLHSNYRDPHNSIHEIAHAYTVDSRVPDPDWHAPVGVGWLYFNHRVKGHCIPQEIYAELLAHVTIDLTASVYLSPCSTITSSGITPDDESQAVATSVINAEIPDWLNTYYDRGDGTVDLDAVWSDVKAGDQKGTTAYLLREMFGGYCSTHEANWALGRSGPRHGSPWVDGGCDWRRPQNLVLTSTSSELMATWAPPLYEADPDVNRYVVQWRARDEQYSPSRQAIVSESSRSHSVEGLVEGVEYFVRVAAVNNGSPTVLVDDDGHSRTAEESAVFARAARPVDVAAASGNSELFVTWEAPADDGGLNVTGYLVEWKSGSQSYHSSRRVREAGASARSATVTGLTNGTEYTLRVYATAPGDVSGAPSPELTVKAGLPGVPGSVEATGGRDSVLVWWGEADGHGSDVSSYVVQWREKHQNYHSAREAVVADPAAVTDPAPWTHVVTGLDDHRVYWVRVLAVNTHGRSVPSDEYETMSGAPGPPTEFAAVSRDEGGFVVSWKRPDPYYPNNPDYRPVLISVDGDRVPVLDATGATVPQFRYDIEYRRVGDEDWCDRHRNLDYGDSSLDPAPFTHNYTAYCSGTDPVIGQSYEFRIRASYLLLLGGTDFRNGPWAYSEPVVYSPG